MFDFVRKHNKIMQVLLFLLILPSFVLFGVDGYNRMRDKGDAVAVVDGHEIMQSEWDAAHKNEMERLRAANPKADVKSFESPLMRYATLEALVNERVLRAAVTHSVVTVSDEKIAQIYASDPGLASFQVADPDRPGKLKFDLVRFQQATGMSPQQYDAKLRADLQLRQVTNSISGTGTVSNAQAEVTLSPFFEKREIQVQQFLPTDYAQKIKPTEAEVEAYYKSHTKQFQEPEQADIAYVVLDPSVISKNLELNAQDLKTYYEQNMAKLSIPEERHASHILIKAASDAPAAEREKAKAKAEKLLLMLQKSPESFAALAKKNSDDDVSATKGGDLGAITKDGAYPKPLQDAAFTLTQGAVSGLIESEYGYHILQVTQIKTAKARSFEEMRPSIEADLRKQQAQKKFPESAEIFTNTVYEQSSSLAPVADKLKLNIESAMHISRQPLANAKGVLASEKFLNAIFASDAIEKKRNTEAVDLGASRLASGRIVKYTPARTLTFEEAKDKAREQLVKQRSDEMAKRDGAEKLLAYQANKVVPSLPPAITVSREQPQNQPVAVVDAAMRADKTKLPVWMGVDLGEGAGYGIVKVSKVLDSKVDPAKAEQGKQLLLKLWTAAESAAYLNLLKNRFHTKINVPKPSVL